MKYYSNNFAKKYCATLLSNNFIFQEAITTQPLHCFTTLIIDSMLEQCGIPDTTVADTRESIATTFLRTINQFLLDNMKKTFFNKTYLYFTLFFVNKIQVVIVKKGEGILE